MTVYQNCRKRTYKLKSNLDLGEESGFLGSKKILLFVLLANFLRTPSSKIYVFASIKPVDSDPDIVDKSTTV